MDWDVAIFILHAYSLPTPLTSKTHPSIPTLIHAYPHTFSIHPTPSLILCDRSNQLECLEWYSGSEYQVCKRNSVVIRDAVIEMTDTLSTLLNALHCTSIDPPLSLYCTYTEPPSCFYHASTISTQYLCRIFAVSPRYLLHQLYPEYFVESDAD